MSFQPTSGKGLCQRSGTGAPWPGHGLWQRLGWGDMAGRDKPWPCKMMSNPGESPLLLACRFCCPPIGCFALCTSLHHYWLVVSNMFYFPSHIWDNPSHWHIFFQICYCTTNEIILVDLRWTTTGTRIRDSVMKPPLMTRQKCGKSCERMQCFWFSWVPRWAPWRGHYKYIYIYIWFLSLFVYNPSCDNTCLVKLLFQNTNGHLYII